MRRNVSWFFYGFSIFSTLFFHISSISKSFATYGCYLPCFTRPKVTKPMSCTKRRTLNSVWTTNPPPPILSCNTLDVFYMQIILYVPCTLLNLTKIKLHIWSFENRQGYTADEFMDFVIDISSNGTCRAIHQQGVMKENKMVYSNHVTDLTIINS